MKKLTLFSALLATAIPYAVSAEENAWDGKLTGSVGFVSDYVFRGISQTAEAPAVQGNIDYVMNNGFKLGTWGSNVDFSDASLEMDFYGSYTHSLDQWTAETGIVYYTYPGANADFNFYELYASLGYDFGLLSLTGSFNFTPENLNHSGNGTYTRLTAKAPLPHDLGLEASLGHQTIEDQIAFGLPDYTDWSAALTYTAAEPVTLKLQYIDTNLTTTQCADGCDAKLVLGVSATF